MLNEKLLIDAKANLRDALKRLDEGAERILFVVDEHSHLLGTLTDGDARRALLDGRDLTAAITGIYNIAPISFCITDNYMDAVREVFTRRKITHIPLLDTEGVIVDCLRPESLTDSSEVSPGRSTVIDLPVIIMAGGKGTRMAPFTNVLPKPLIPIGDKTIIELIMDEFARYGVRDFRLTLNYKGEMIRAYFQGSEREYNISYAWEKDFLGTAGSIRLVTNLGDTFIVSNCDILVKADFGEVISFHKQNKAALTIISSIQHHKVPYGVVDFGQGGRVNGIREKPEFTFPINTGVYVLDKLCLDFIPEGVSFNMTDLIDALLCSGKAVYTFPINEGDYLDIGQWEEYRRVVSSLS